MFDDSGGDLNSRVTEAHKIVGLLEEFLEQMQPNEKNFVEQMADCDHCSPKQLFWLRDIKEKYL
jgi:hypothetical protein